jgi:hypothetical protein
VTDKRAIRRQAKSLGTRLGSLTLLNNREAVINCTAVLMGLADSEVIGMGRTCAWIKLPEFRVAVEQARKDGVDFKVVVFYEKTTDRHAATWTGLGAKVKYYEHGPIRIALYDRSDAILAFPRQVAKPGEDRDYFGFYIHDRDVVADLHAYAMQVWSAGSDQAGLKGVKNYVTNVYLAAGLVAPR